MEYEGVKIIIFVITQHCGTPLLLCLFFTKLDRDTAANLLLKKQLTDMKDENEILKNTVHRLSVELSEFQAKFRTLKPEERSVWSNRSFNAASQQ